MLSMNTNYIIMDLFQRIEDRQGGRGWLGGGSEVGEKCVSN